MTVIRTITPVTVAATLQPIAHMEYLLACSLSPATHKLFQCSMLAHIRFNSERMTTVRSESTAGGPVTSGKPDDAGRLGRIPKLEPVSAFFTWRTRQVSGVANTKSTALNIYFVLEFFFGEGRGGIVILNNKSRHKYKTLDNKY